MTQELFKNGIKPVIAVTLFAIITLVAPLGHSSEGEQCSVLLAESQSRGGVELSAEQTRLFDLGARGVIKLLFEQTFTAEEKLALWRGAVADYKAREFFVNDEVPFLYEGQKVVAFVGVASATRRSLLFILPDGSVYLTNTPDYLQTVLERLGGGIRGVVDGTSPGVIEPTDFLIEYLGNILSFAMGKPIDELLDQRRAIGAG